jgi:hypothetical protein
MWVKDQYENYPIERNDYMDIAEISRNICDKILAKQTDDFAKFFDNLELILNNCTGVCTCHILLISLYSTGTCKTPCSINL